MINKSFIIRVIVITAISVLLSLTVKHEILSISSLTTVARFSDFRTSDLYTSTIYKSAIHYKSESIVILSLDKCNREDLLRSLEIVNKYNPAVIGLDILIEHSQANDSLLIEFLNKNENIVFSALLNDDCTQLYENYFKGLLYNYNYGAVNFPTTSSNYVRFFKNQYVYNEELPINSFASEIVKHYAPDKLEDLILYEKEFGLIPIAFENVDIDNLSCIDLLENSIPDIKLRELIENKIILLGTTSDSNDFFSTPFNNFYPGVKIHAHIIDTILKGNYIKDINKFIYFIVNLLICLIFVIVQDILEVKLSDFCDIIMRIIQIILLLTLYLVGVYLYSNNIYLNCSFPILAVLISNIVRDFYLGINNLLNRYGSVWISKLKQ